MRLNYNSLLLFAAFSSGLCMADTVYLSDGSEVEGTIVEQNSDQVVLKREDGRLQTFRRKDVDAVVRDKPAPKKPVAKVEEPAPEEKKTDEKKPDDATPAEAKPAEKKPDAAAPAEAQASEKKPDAVAPADKQPAAAADGKKPADGKTDKSAKTPPKKDDDKDEAARKDDWVAPPGLPGFPDHAERMAPDQEAVFMSALERLATTEEAPRLAAKNEIQNLGAAALPYLVAGLQHINVEARSSCMSLIGQLGGRNCVKFVIEVFYSAMPEQGAAPTFQTPFIRAIKSTLPAISGQSFIYVEPDKELVQDGLQKYIDWYKANYDRIPAQLGEAKVEPTDPDYDKKMKEARELKLARKSWPRPPLSADIVGGENAKRAPKKGEDYIRQGDEDRTSLPKVPRDDAFKRR